MLLTPGDPGCLLRWDRGLCEVLEHVRARCVNPEDLLILILHLKKHLVTVHLIDEIVANLNASMFPGGPLIFDSLSAFVAKLDFGWSKLHTYG